MIKVAAKEFLKLMNGLNYAVFLGRDDLYPNLNIVGYRNKFGRPNYFDDTISVYWENEGRWQEEHYEATTLPGTPNLLKPVSPKGAAILKPGQYRGAYSIGTHRGKYPALVQSKAVRVYRDNNLDNVYDRVSGTEEEGVFGINIHRASIGAKVVGVDSAGCQVIKNRPDFENFMLLCKSQRSEGVNNFTYTLVEI